MFRKTGLLALLFIGVLLLTGIQAIAQNTCNLTTNAWFEIQNKQGDDVTLNIRGDNRKAETGDKLCQGDSIRVGRKASASISNSEGTVIRLRENTEVTIQQLNFKLTNKASAGTAIGRFVVSSGRIYVRKKGKSRIIIEGPGGTAAPKGTIFGITVEPGGKMGIATEEGLVVTEAQGQEVEVKSKFQNLIPPGKAPSKAVALKNDTNLYDKQISIVTNDKKEKEIRIRGRVDSVNLLTIAGELEKVNSKGEFDTTRPFPLPAKKLEAIITTPLLTDEDPISLWSQTCEPLLVNGGDAGQTTIQKTVNLSVPLVGIYNPNTDFLIPSDKIFSHFWVEVISDRVPSTSIDVYLKYSDGSSKQFFSEKDPDNADKKYALIFPETFSERPNVRAFQVNTRIGGELIPSLIGASYRASVYGCNPQ